MDVYFLQSNIETLIKTVKEEHGIEFFGFIRFIFDERELTNLVDKKYLTQHINVYKYLLTIPSLQDQRDTLHRYVIYFESRIDTWKKPPYWLTGDYFRILRPVGWERVALVASLILQRFWNDTVPLYQIPILGDVLEDRKVKLSDLTFVRNIVRMLCDTVLTFCIFAGSLAIKKKMGMGNPRT